MPIATGRVDSHGAEYDDCAIEGGQGSGTGYGNYEYSANTIPTIVVIANSLSSTIAAGAFALEFDLMRWQQAGGLEGPDNHDRSDNRPPCDSAGKAPDPSAYQKEAQMTNQLSIPFDPTGLSQITALSLTGGELLDFRRGAANDAQAYGASSDYANYVVGDFTGALGLPLSTALAGANLYAYCCSAYAQNKVYDPDYQSIPANNVKNITNGYNDQKNNSLCHKQGQ